VQPGRSRSYPALHHCKSGAMAQITPFTGRTGHAERGTALRGRWYGGHPRSQRMGRAEARVHTAAQGPPGRLGCACFGPMRRGMAVVPWRWAPCRGGGERGRAPGGAVRSTRSPFPAE
jgi:hypothetical protein